MPNKLPLDATRSLYHILSVMHETGGSKMDAASPHSQSHLGPWAVASKWHLGWCKGSPPPLAESGTLLSPRECQLRQTPASLLELKCLSKSGQTFKGFGSGMVGTMGTLWLCSSLGLRGSASEIRPAWQRHCCRSSHRKLGVANKSS